MLVILMCPSHALFTFREYLFNMLHGPTDGDGLALADTLSEEDGDSLADGEGDQLADGERLADGTIIIPPSPLSPEIPLNPGIYYS